MTVLTLEKERTISEVLVKETAMAVSFGIVYFIMCVINPLAGLSGAVGLFSANIRWANLLRAFSLVSPGASIGIFMANTAFFAYSGKVIYGSYSLINLSCLVVSLGVYAYLQKTDRGYKREILCLAGLGLFTGILTKLNLVFIAILLEGASISLLFESMVWVKIGISVATFTAGYPLLMLVRRVQNDKHEQGSSIK